MTAPALDLETMAATLAQSPDFKVLRRFVARQRYNEEFWALGEPPETRLGVYVDCETTSLDRGAAEIIEFAAVPFTYDYRTGVVYDVHPPLSYFEEPKGGIPDEITEITGITADMVRGQRLDDSAINGLVASAQLIVAHNAEYDRPILEGRLPIFAEKHWGCSQRDVDWSLFGCVGAKLENVLAGACGEFVDDAHRAETDCQVGVHVLATAQHDGHSALWHLLEAARLPTVRITAVSAPFDKKEAIKSRHPKYRWCDGTTGTKGWFVDVKPAEVNREVAWLRESVYRGDPIVEFTKFNSRVRYSSRVDR
jgi:DNA polymerase-3 subunit epsilon